MKQIRKILITIIGTSYMNFHLYSFIPPYFSQVKNKRTAQSILKTDTMTIKKCRVTSGHYVRKQKNLQVYKIILTQGNNHSHSLRRSQNIK